MANNPHIVLRTKPLYTYVKFRLDVSNSDVRIVTGMLTDAMKGHPIGYKHMAKYKTRRWDGWIRLYKHKKFPSGLLPKAIEVLEDVKEGMELGYMVLKPKVPAVDFHGLYARTNVLNSDVKLRDYQMDAITELLKAGRGIAHMATNAGKTFIMAALCNLVGGKAVIIVHSKELLHQVAEVINDNSHMSVGLFGDGYKNVAQDVIVATIQSLSKFSGLPDFTEFADSVDLLLIDEAHHTSARTVYDTVMKIPAVWRYGFSGTPLKYQLLPDLQLMAATGDIVVRVGNMELIDKGYSALPEITMYRIGTMATGKMTYQEVYKELIVDNDVRNTKIADVSIQQAIKDKVVLVLVNRLDHQTAIRDRLEASANGRNVVIVNGKQPSEMRNGILNDMRSGIPGIYVATTVFSEGVDIPSIDTLIIGGGGKSHIRLLQQVGRGLRQKENGNTVNIIDFMDGGHRYIKKHSDRRLDIYRAEGFVVNVTNI